MKTLLYSLIYVILVLLFSTGCESTERQVFVTSNGKIIDTVHPSESKEFYLGQTDKGRILRDNNTKQNDQAKLTYNELMNCPSCSVSLQHIIYTDKDDNQKKETDAYSVLQDGTLFYVTVEEMKVVKMDQIISYTDGVLLRYQGRKPSKGYEINTDKQGNVATNLNPENGDEADDLPPVVLCNRELESLEKEHSAVYKSLYNFFESSRSGNIEEITTRLDKIQT